VPPLHGNINKEESKHKDKERMVADDPCRSYILTLINHRFNY